MIPASLINWAKKQLEAKKKDNCIEYAQLSDLTIIIPSFCRQNYLVRQLVLWAYTNATIIIVDGTPKPIASQVIKMISELQNVTYMHLNISYINRIKESCNFIKTSYSICLADDDIYLKDGLCCAVEYLNHNDDVIACVGQLIGVDYDEKKLHAYYFPYGGSLENYNVKHEDSKSRIRFAMDGYRTATSYAVFRSNEFKKIWDGMQSISCLQATEYEHAISTYAVGSLSSVNAMYWLRSYECDPVDSVIDGTRETTFELWWEEREFQTECLAFIQRLANKIRVNSNLTEKEATIIINDAVDCILNGKHSSLMNQTVVLIFFTRILNIVKMFSFVDNLINKLRSTAIGISIRTKIRSMIRGVTSVSDKPGLSENVTKELEEMLLLIDSFHVVQYSSKKI